MSTPLKNSNYNTPSRHPLTGAGIEKTIRLIIRYELDEEHGLEFKFVDDQIEQVGGIAET
ncbi:hypothetical protein [Niabella hibiscisoli]|uniref:hypothetical protein n=1 Tax=Niabella hibiscisoli TaxID=1825928 RepID=UPI001F0E93E2|nr:hypothetical protein [Niabella hibiscisoli]MCH5717116.1 hypothetical protein [Niabella hibiscisoli]